MKKPNQNLSPFKFLAAYEAKDADAFWGRNDEIEKLYELLLATNLVMVYGPSGIGKTSLIQCGLSKKFNGPDWIPRFIRRGDNFNHSLLAELQKISPEKGLASIDENIQAIDNKYHRPVYLFFDQFEEIFTINEKDESKSLEELTKLFQTLEQFRKSSTCKIIIIIREEFLGQLYDYEQHLSYLFDFRLRVEPMSKTKIEEVVTETFKKFNISCTTQKLPFTIANKLMEGKANVQLSYLQVYLDKIWNDAFKKKYLNYDEDFDELKIEISQENLDSVGSIENVLENYIETTSKSIAEEKKINLPFESIWALLDFFVTEEGTKKPLTFRTIRSLSKELMPEEVLGFVLEKLDDFRLIRKDNEYYELAHDTLAKIIDSKRTGTQLLIKNLKASIRFSMDRNSRLDDVIIKNYDELENQKIDLNLEQEIINYVVESKKYRRNQKWIFRLLLAFVVVAGLASSYLYIDANKAKLVAEQKTLKAEDALEAQLKAEAEREIGEDNDILIRINKILDSDVNNLPDITLENGLKKMTLKRNREGFKNKVEFFKRVDATIKKLENKKLKSIKR